LIDILKKKSIYAYLIISLIVILNSFSIFLFLQEQENSGKTINIAGKQRMIIQRIALLSNNYFYNLNKQDTKKKIQQYLEESKLNQEYLKNLNNQIADNILYGPGYQFDNILKQYNTNVIKFLNNPTDKLLKIINYTNESLLSTSDALTTLLATDNDKRIRNTIYLLIISTIVILFIIYMIYKKVTLVSIKETKKNIDKLDEQKSFMSTILENSAHAIIATDVDGIITLFNKAAEEMLGYSADELVLKETPAKFHKVDDAIEKAEQLNKEFDINLKPGFGVFIEKTNRDLPNQDEWTYINKDAHEIIVKLSITRLVDHNNVITGYLGIAEDITDMKNDEIQVKKYVELINQNIITSSTDLKGKITYTSEAFCQKSGYTKDELIGKNHNIVRHPDMSDDIYSDLWEHLSNDKVWSGEIKNLKKDGTSYWVKANISPNYDLNGNKVGYTAIRHDITDKKLIEIISITDGLTDIFNRRYFDDIFPNILKTNIRSKEYISFLMMDVDHFKQYNDIYGHQMGDNVLINIAKTLKKSLKRKDDLCFRLGGEEFGLVFYSDNQDEALHYAHTIKENLENMKIEHSGNSASKYVTASMGLICLEPNQVENEDVIYREADKLLYEAKEQGRNKVIMKGIS